jgi:hypothetical protein
MTIFDPISGRQITVDLSGKPSGSINRQECFSGGERQVRAGQRLRAGVTLKSPDLSPQKRSKT